MHGRAGALDVPAPTYDAWAHARPCDSLRTPAGRRRRSTTPMTWLAWARSRGCALGTPGRGRRGKRHCKTRDARHHWWCSFPMSIPVPNFAHCEVGSIDHGIRHLSTRSAFAINDLFIYSIFISNSWVIHMHELIWNAIPRLANPRLAGWLQW